MPLFMGVYADIQELVRFTFQRASPHLEGWSGGQREGLHPQFERTKVAARIHQQMPARSPPDLPQNDLNNRCITTRSRNITIPVNAAVKVFAVEYPFNLHLGKGLALRRFVAVAVELPGVF